jgi:hypothetical protein
MRLLVATLAAVVLAAACGGGGGGGGNERSGACTEVRERLDPASARHLLPGAPAPRYLTDPPTSGAHALVIPPRGALDAPIPKPVQVAILEAGGVIIQYRGLPPAAVARLRELAGGDVRVAPAATLPAPVVATAWTRKLTCSAVDVAALRRFAAAHAGRGPGHGGPPG